MKILIYSSIVFLIILGIISKANNSKTIEVTSLTDKSEINIPILIENAEIQTLDDEKEDDTRKNYPLNLLMTGEYHGEDIDIKKGTYKNWLGLYRKNNKYFLMPTVIKVKAVRDFLEDEKSKDMSGKKVSSSINLPSIFLLEKAKMLRQGEVKTLFYGDEENSENISRNYVRTFKFNGEEYTLSVEDKEKNDEKWLTPTSNMILTVGNKRQIIYKEGGCNDCSWTLNWVGDLDQDGKLDFMFNLTPHYNVTSHSLFLSSQAENNEIVHEVANLSTVGC